MSDQPPGPGRAADPGSEEELRARLEEELRRVTVSDVVVQTVVSLVNLGGQRLGLTPDSRDLRDLAQVRTAIEAVRALLPILDQEMGDQVQPVHDALAQLQLAYAREVGAAPAPGATPAEPAGGTPESPQPPGRPAPDPGPGPAQAPRPGGAPGRLWVPPGSKT